MSSKGSAASREPFPMNLLDFSDALLRRTSQFNLQDWLRVFACIVLGSYALLLARRK